MWSAASLADLDTLVSSSEKISLTDAGLTLGPDLDAGDECGRKRRELLHQADRIGLPFVLRRDELHDDALERQQGLVGYLLTNLSTTLTGSEGFSIALSSGAIAAGDSFVIQPVREAARNLSVNAAVASDPRLVAGGHGGQDSEDSDQ